MSGGGINGRSSGEGGIEGARERVDIDLIVSKIPEGSKVLDLGCGDGSLLARIIEKGCYGVGVEIDEEMILACIEKGIPVIHEDIDQGLGDYPDGAYDIVILSQTLQMTRRPARVIDEILRVGKKAIVSFPNFGNWRIRLSLLLRGTTPKSKSLPFEWYETPNLHFLSIRDFKSYCRRAGIRILEEVPLSPSRHALASWTRPLDNILAEAGLFVISR